jgi:hypothetical protein
MNKQIILLAALVLAHSSGAQNVAATNEVPVSISTNSAVQTNACTPRQEKQGESGKSKKSRSSKHRRLKLMERELDRIGVTEEERAQIMALQRAYKEKMCANADEIEVARDKLTILLDEGASMEMLEAAIEEVSAAQAEQLRILVMNRIEMERILGQEKHDEFMKNARQQYQKHGRHGGPPLPPRPGQPAATPPTPTTPPQAPPAPGS